MHKNIAMSWAKTIEEAKHKLKLNASALEECHSHCVIAPIHGIGQGLSNGPCLWLIISSVSLHQHDETPDESISIQIFLVRFVDDANGNVNSFTKNIQPPIQELMDKMQHDAQLWHDLLWNSGGTLELPKCFYQILHWEFNNGRPILMGKSNSKLQVESANGEPMLVKEKLFTPLEKH